MGNYKGFVSVICVIIMLVCGFLGVKSIFYSSANNVVPDVVGMKSQEAVTAMKDAGFIPFIDRVTASAPSDTVVSQSFEAGTKQTKGTTIYLRVSFGGSSMEIPDVTGMKLDDAVKKLQDIGLTVDEIRKMPNKEHPAGVVFAQSPSSPQTVDTSTKITLLVSSSGDESALIQIPNLIGKSQAEATSLIEAAGLKLGEVKLKRSENVADGCVVSQTPNFGLSVSAGTAVSIDVSSSNVLDDLSIERDAPEQKTAPIKRVVVENKEELEREASNENLKKRPQTAHSQTTKQVKETSKQKIEKKQEIAKQSTKTTQNKISRKLPNTVDNKKSNLAPQARKTSASISQVPKESEIKQAKVEIPDKQQVAQALPAEETKQVVEPFYGNKIAKIRYQTPPLTRNGMSLKIVIRDNNGTRVLRDGVARSLEYISLNARYDGTAKITIYLGGEEVWHDKYN